MVQNSRIVRLNLENLSDYWNLISKCNLESKEKTIQEVIGRLGFELTLLAYVPIFFNDYWQIIPAGTCKIKLTADYIYFGGMYISPTARGRGICNELNNARMKIIKERIDKLKEKGYTKIRSEILGTGEGGSVNPQSIGAYKSLIRLGFKEVGVSEDEDKGIVLEYIL